MQQSENHASAKNFTFQNMTELNRSAQTHFIKMFVTHVNYNGANNVMHSNYLKMLIAL